MASGTAVNGTEAESTELGGPVPTVVVDNLLWDGRASGAVAADDASTNAIREFNRKFVKHPSLDATILPVGDGFGIGVKR